MEGEKKKMLFKCSIKKRDYLTLLCGVIFLTFTLGIYAPFEIYLMNVNEFWFDLSMFVWVPILISIIAGIGLFLIGILLREEVFDTYTAFLFGLALAVYVQGNFLNLDVGVLNGAGIDWTQYKDNFTYNLIIWLLLVATPVIGINLKAKISRKILTGGSMLLTAMQLVSLVVLLVNFSMSDETYMHQSDETDVTTVKYVSNKNLFNISEDENIVVFLLDMYDDRYFKNLLQSDPELEEALDGFTYFTNSTGSYSTTHYSVGSLLGGGYFHNTEPYLEELNTMYADSKMVQVLEENNFRLDLYTPAEFVPSDMREGANISNYIAGKEIIGDYPLFAKYLYQTVMCRYMPNILKPHIWMDGTEFSTLKSTGEEYSSFNDDNSAFYEAFKESGIVTQNEEKCFKFIHLMGTHYPYTINKNIEKVDESETSELECAYGVLQIVIRYMAEMKEKGVYDNSSIIIMADHGFYADGVLTNPVLLVKPKGADGKMTASGAPVSHHDFQPSILYLAGLNNNEEFGESYFDIQEGEERERLFYQYYLTEENHIESNWRMIEYQIDSESNKRENFHLTDVEYLPNGEKIAHKDNCAYCQSGAVDPIETEENVPVMVVHNSLYY